ncbi:MAG: IS630 family transposase, partial [Saprospiraceae bacterium]|nr:IS630 family transposase [Saprospiraceae bacterium]
SLRIVDINEADATAAKYEFLNHPEPIVQRRMHCLRLKYRGYSNKAIADILEVSRNTVGNYLSLYEQFGLEGIKTLNYQGPTSKLDKHQAKVEASFREQPPKSAKEARSRIKKLTGLKRSLPRVRAFMNRMGMKPRATGQIPAKADPVRQKEFHDQTLQPLLQKAQAGQCHVLFMDGVHFVLAAFVALVWCFERVFVKTAPGRFRLNVLGAIHATSLQLTAVYNDTYITASTVVELLERIARQYAGLPIHIILDNARYQHCHFVKDAAQRLNINLVFLPPYSPNLNVIERLWKFVKAEVCAANYFKDAKAFQNAIIHFLNNLDRKPIKKQVKSRITLNFQLFSHAQNLAA